MTNRRRCAFQLVRYVPDPVRNEFVHIGVLLREDGDPGHPARLDLRFTHDWRRVRCLDPDADTALLEGMETELRQRLQQEALLAESERRLTRILDESLSLNLQITEPKAYLAESLPAGMEELMRLYVDPPPRERVARLRGRAAIQAAMRSEFERAQVWDLMRKQIRAADYTRPGDPLRIDLGYRPNGVIKMFHAVSLEPGVEMAKILAFSSAGLRAGIERVEKAQFELTAIVEPAARIGASDEAPERLELYRFAIDTMEEHQIRVLTTTQLPDVARTARRELRLE
ncbi:MAG TPA: DUF3037 domain-containing protein [Terracidiphilus sp.]|jgi:hypothetical protein|nr:DUF3037 domain-containing protein [Terracidiphilus sp.]